VSTANKLLEPDALAERIAALRAAGKTVALANGLFDVLHVGHLRYLEGAKNEADVLVVALNSDASARALKGPSRPVMPEAERAELVAGFGCVDLVTIFRENDVETLLERLRPDVHCKGTDYTPDNVPEAPVARRLGIRVAIVGDPKQHATREIIRRIRDEGEGAAEV
jgi:rfaE bifunctional protein nucleotidyltransferase chain/domain